MTEIKSTARLDEIAAGGNRPPLDVAGIESWKGKDQSNWIHCADGFKVSVLAGDGMYCLPRPGICGTVPSSFSGPYTELEVGFPSVRPEPWEQWSTFAEAPDAPIETVYAFVPVELVRALIVAHGGER